MEEECAEVVAFVFGLDGIFSISSLQATNAHFNKYLSPFNGTPQQMKRRCDYLGEMP